ncbi:hypothetical protein APU16_07075 [Escherichia coli]|nr:hypothetical protein APU16_07075 [Escherichia coli]
MQLFLPKSIRNWQKFIRQINCQIYAANSFVGGMMEEELIQDGLSCLLRTGALRHTAMITMGSSILLAVLPGLIRRMRDTGHIRDLHHHMAEAKPVHEILHLTIS